MLSAPICSVLGTRAVLWLWVTSGCKKEGGGLGFPQGTPQDGGWSGPRRPHPCVGGPWGGDRCWGCGWEEGDSRGRWGRMGCCTGVLPGAPGGVSRRTREEGKRVIPGTAVPPHRAVLSRAGGADGPGPAPHWRSSPGANAEAVPGAAQRGGCCGRGPPPLSPGAGPGPEGAR